MNAHDKFLAASAPWTGLPLPPLPSSARSTSKARGHPRADAQVNQAATRPASVASRTRRSTSATPQAPTPTGPPGSTCKARTRCCAAWIAERGDTELLPGARLKPGRALRRPEPCDELRSPASPSRAAPGRAPTSPQMHYGVARHRHAGNGIRGDPRESAPNRECAEYEARWAPR